MQPTIYSTKSANTGKEPIRQVKSYDKVLVQFTDAIITDTRTGEERNEGFRSVVCIVSKFGNLFVYHGLTSRGKSLESCKRSTNRLLRKAYGMELDAAISEGETLEQMHASFTDESVHENFKQWAASLFE